MMMASGLEQQQRHARSSLKRSACDRCRNQKLRCLRDIGDGAACRRCVRASVPCVTSPPRPPGRPVRSTTAADQRSATSQDGSAVAGDLPPTGAEEIVMCASSISGRYNTAAPEARRNAGADIPAAMASPLLRHLTGTTDYSLEIDDSDIMPLDWAFTDEADFLKVPFSGSGLDNAPALSEASLTTDVFHPQRWFDASSHLLSQSCRSTRAASVDLDGAESRSSPPRPGFGYQSTSDRHAMSDAAFHLSHLNLGLSEQLFFFTTKSWEEAMAVILCADDDPAMQETSQPNPLGEVLRNTSKFLSIVQRIKGTLAIADSKGRTSRPRRLTSPPPSRRSPFSPEPALCPESPILAALVTPQSSYATPAPSSLCPTPTNSTPVLSCATALALLSSYLHLIAIYDALFRHMLASLSRTPASSISTLQTVPGLRLAGVPVVHGGLQIKMLIQVIEHHLDAIDGALGLPCEYRVCGDGAMTQKTPGSGGGLLGGKEWEGLLKVVIGGSAGVTVEQGVADIVSLRQNIGRVQRYL